MGIFNFLGKNISELLLLVGLISILIHIYMSFGIAFAILGFGIINIISSIIIELNKKARGKS